MRRLTVTGAARWLGLCLCLLILCSCGRGGRERAKRDIKQAGKEFTADGFVRAAADGDAALVEAYLRAGLDRNAQDARGISPLMAAAVAGKAGVVKLLLDENASPNLQDKGGNTALLLAADANQPAAVRALVEGNADVRVRNRENLTPLLKAANSKFDAVAEALLATSKDQLAKDGQLDRALLVCALLDNDKMLNALLDKGANPNARIENGQTALMFAASFGRQGIVEILLNRGADPRLVDKDGANASVLALQKGHPEISRLLDAKTGGNANANPRLVATVTPPPAPSPADATSPSVPAADAASVARERAWLKENGVEPTDLLKKDTGQDDDGDGYTNDEELAAGTDPNDAKSHPPAYSKLKLRRVEGEKFPVAFESLNSKTNRAAVAVREGGDERRVELAPGERVPGLPYKVVKTRPKKGYQKDTGALEDRSELTLLNTDTNQRVVLVRGMDSNSPDATAVLAFGANGEPMSVRLGEEIAVPRDPQGTKLQVIDIRPTQVVLKIVGSGQTVTVNKD